MAYQRSASDAGAWTCVIALIGGGLSACTTPSTTAFQVAERAQLERSTEQGTVFRHVVFQNSNSGRVLRVYLEGDGTPYIDHRVVATDPTPRNPLMLRLMTLDRQAAVYVGRPCYFSLSTDPGCSSKYWTSARFSVEVVDSLAAVIRREAISRDVVAIELVGHSGGGSLAVLLAEQLPETVRVITIAGNLDTDAWTALHDYAPLAASLNPVSARLRPEVAEQSVHYVGARDRIVPPELVRAAAANIGGTVREIAEFTHACCWERDWIALVEQAPE